jgi:6-phosphogluconolactonase (cycloisomerase 2 family)
MERISIKQKLEGETMMSSALGFSASTGHIPQRRWFVPVIALAVAIVLWTPALSWGDSDDVVYVESNSINGNSILAFRNNGSGMLSFIGSTPAGGKGVYDPTFTNPPKNGTNDTDQAIQISSDRRLLFAVNSGSNSVAVFHIFNDGSLQAVLDSPFPSGGTDPVSVGLKGDILAVANKDQDPSQNPFLVLPNYTSFRVGDDGGLTPIPGSTVSVAYYSSPSQVLPASLGELFFGADTLGALLHSFRIEDGRLLQNLPVAAPTSAYAGLPTPHYMIGLQTHPTLPILYVGFTLAKKLGVYRYSVGGGPGEDESGDREGEDGDRGGKVSFVRAVANSGNGICWITLNRAGTRIYTVNTFDNSVSVYDSTNPWNPVEIQHLYLVNNLAGPGSLALDRSEQFLYVLAQRLETFSKPFSNAIHVLKVGSDGKLTEAAGSPTTVAPFINGDTTVQGLAVY